VKDFNLISDKNVNRTRIINRFIVPFISKRFYSFFAPTIKDFLADVKNEVVLGKGDIRIRLHSNIRNTFISASTNTLIAFSNFQDNDMEVRFDKEIYPVTIQ
jgi:hypothetical protein